MGSEEVEYSKFGHSQRLKYIIISHYVRILNENLLFSLYTHRDANHSKISLMSGIIRVTYKEMSFNLIEYNALSETY